MFKSALLIGSFLTLAAVASEADRTEELNGVELKSFKQDDTRTFQGHIEKNISSPIDHVKKSVTNFTEKCNNSLKSKRNFTSKDFDCKYHNENDNVVESIVITNIKANEDFKGFSENYLLGRTVYNRGSYEFYELVQVKEGMNDKNQKTVTVSLRMLNDSEVKTYTEPKFSQDSTFDKSTSQFTLTQISPNQTHLTYDYTAETNHWLLNKELSVPQVFASISKTVSALVETVEEASNSGKREVASQEE